MLSKAQMVSIRKTLESAYTGVCKVFEYKSLKDENGITHKRETLTAENIPCRISFENSLPAENSGFEAQAHKKVKIFLPPGAAVKEGSRLVIAQNGQTFVYFASGSPSVYFSHQEIEALKPDTVT